MDFLPGRIPVAGISIGHSTLNEARTGCTVLLHEQGGPYAVTVIGGAAALRQTSMLDPAHSARLAHGFCLTGGSGFGLSASSGALRYLSEQGVGMRIGSMVVPSIPAAAIYDLGVGLPVWPGEQQGYEAAKGAGQAQTEGRVGVGTGATIGKVMGIEHASTGGFALYGVTDRDFNLGVAVVVNAFGNVCDPDTGQVVAGVRGQQGFMDAEALLIQARGPKTTGFATTLAVVVTDAALDYQGALAVARIVQAGFYKTLCPAATPMDGDVLFVWSVGNKRTTFFKLALAAKKVLIKGIVRAASMGA